MSRLRLRTTAMSIAPGSSVQPYSAAWRTRWATRALQISFLLGMQAMLGQEPPIHLRSTTAVVPRLHAVSKIDIDQGGPSTFPKL